MALTLPAAWVEAMSGARVEPVFLVIISTDNTPANDFRSLSGNTTDANLRTKTDTTQSVVQDVTPLAIEQDIFTRKVSIGELAITFEDDYLRRILANNRLKGKRVVVKVTDIEKRIDAKTSGMPSNFAHTLSSQDVADVAAWLMKRPTTK